MSPLPFAPPPKDSSLYQQLESTTLQTLTPDQLDTIRAKTFSQGTEGNEDEYRRLLLLGLGADKLSISGPLPGTQKIIQTTYTSTGDDADFFKPDQGEVWQIVGGDTLAVGGTGSIGWNLTNSDGEFALIFQTSVSGQEPIFQNTQNANLGFPLYITHENWLYANVIAVATSVRPTISFIRVR